MENNNKIQGSCQSLQTVVSGCFSIDDKKPIVGQEIYYIGNLGLSEGVYFDFKRNTGWVKLPDGDIDCFDEWCSK